MYRARLALIAVGLFAAPIAGAAQCTAESAERRVALLELYTSEGCDSCPPADRWISALPPRGLDAERVVALGFHVDYWNYLGWNDPFAKPEYSARQRAASRRNKARVIYTPQLLLNGRDFRRMASRDDIADRVYSLNREKPVARIRLRLARESPGTLLVHNTVVVPDAAERSAARAYLALYENHLATQVKAGENRGKQLRHDFVVRKLAGPYSIDSQGLAAISHRFEFGADWKPGDLHVAAFVQNNRTGDVLQALALANCPLDR